ncbi:MAG: hypothetical protein ACM359_07310 [Bacillota bacterium]
MAMHVWLAALVGVGMAGVAGAQVASRDFYNRGGVALYDPEIGVVASGPVVVVRPTVSADRKYVTMAMAPQITQVVRIDRFPVARIEGEGFVGGVRPAAMGLAGEAVNASVPMRIRNGEKRFVLNEAGVTWIAPP